MKKKTKTDKIRENPYIVSTIFLGLVVLVLIFNQIQIEKQETLNLCNVIGGTPAWIVEGKILGYGYKGNIDVNELIKNNVEFYYNPNCSACEIQINDFDNWTKYKNSGLTKKCS